MFNKRKVFSFSEMFYELNSKLEASEKNPKTFDHIEKQLNVISKVSQITKLITYYNLT